MYKSVRISNANHSHGHSEWRVLFVHLQLEFCIRIILNTIRGTYLQINSRYLYKIQELGGN